MLFDDAVDPVRGGPRRRQPTVVFWSGWNNCRPKGGLYFTQGAKPDWSGEASKIKNRPEVGQLKTCGWVGG